MVEKTALSAVFLYMNMTNQEMEPGFSNNVDNLTNTCMIIYHVNDD